MSISFLDHVRDIEDPRIPGMVLYPLEDMLLTALAGLLCRKEDFDGIEDICTELATRIASFPIEAIRTASLAVNAAELPLHQELLEEAYLFQTLLRNPSANATWPASWPMAARPAKGN